MAEDELTPAAIAAVLSALGLDLPEVRDNLLHLASLSEPIGPLPTPDSYLTFNTGPHTGEVHA